MNASLQIVTAISVVCRPFLPFTSDKLRGILNLDPIKEEGELLRLLDELAEGEVLIPAGHKIGEATHLFSRIPDEVIEQQVAKLNASQAANTTEESNGSFEALKGEITFDDFTKMDIRTGTILTAEKVKKADKLLQFEVDLGFEKRTIVSGIAKHFAPEETVGKQVLVLANLAPRKIRGVESKGMILLAEDHEGKLTFVNPTEATSNGLSVK
jgi:methionyl-tRNA synthetase